jgi:L-2-hydroxyglutarate oxidase LhgO
MVSGPAQHGVVGLVNLFGIESPGLTGAIVLGEHVVQVLRDADA